MNRLTSRHQRLMTTATKRAHVSVFLTFLNNENKFRF